MDASSPEGTIAGPLMADEIARYRERGYVVPGWRLPADRLAAMRADLDALMAANPSLAGDSLFCPHIVSGGAQGLAGSTAWLDHARIPEVVVMVGQLIGPDVVLWGTTVFGKPAGTGKRVPWHQDGEYWPIRPLATCSAWIALDDATPENGCLRVIPGSHRGGRLRAHDTDDSPDLALNQRLAAHEYDEADAADIVLEAGQVSLHDVYLVHGSEPNRSTRRRAGYVCRYMPASSTFDRALGEDLERRNGAVDYSRRPIWLVAGEDASGRNDYRVGH